MKKRMWPKWVLSALIIMLVIIVLFSTSERANNKVVGISMPTKSSERWLIDAKYIVLELESLGYTPIITFAEDVVGNQASQVKNFIDDEVDLIIVAPIDSSPLLEAFERAYEEGIPVISYDRLIMGVENVDYYISFDNRRVGELQGQYIIDNLIMDGGTKHIELFAGSQDDNNASLFFEGAMSVLRPYIDSGELSIASNQYDFEEIHTLRWDKMIAKSRMTSLLNTYYQHIQVEAILSPYDGISRGVIESLSEAGYSDDNMPVITGQDAESESIRLILDGSQSMTIFKDVRLLAKETASVADKLLKGQDKIHESETTLFNGKEYVSSYFLEPIVVDSENWESILIDSEYYTKEEILED